MQFPWEEQEFGNGWVLRSNQAAAQLPNQEAAKALRLSYWSKKLYITVVAPEVLQLIYGMVSELFTLL